MSSSVPFEQFLDGQAVGDRKVALLLHSLAASDRRWLLAQLSPAQAARIQALLSELQELRWPLDEALLQEVIAPAAVQAPAQSHPDAQLEAPQWLNAGANEPAQARRMLWMAAPAHLQARLRDAWSIGADESDGLNAPETQLPAQLALAIRTQVASVLPAHSGGLAHD